MLPSLGFDDTFAMVIRGEDARRLNLKTLSRGGSLYSRSGGLALATNSWNGPMAMRGSHECTDCASRRRPESSISGCSTARCSTNKSI